MEPRPLGRGNNEVVPSITGAIELQWGRGLSAAEIIVIAINPQTHAPLQWGRGLSAAETRTS